MKKYIIVSFILVLSACGSNGTTTSFKVWGNCGMCEKTIEKAANSVNGVMDAQWDKETHIMELEFDAEKTTADEVQQAIAASGYDTEKHTGNETAYNQLHTCCKYKRKN